MLKLSARMQMAADMVRPGGVLCDIGTDHAYLPSYLVLNGIIPSALACDIGRGPLDNARKSVEEYGISDKVALRLSDGLNEVKPYEASDFAFCGMGGTLMAELIGRAQWLKDKDKRIIAQPMSHVDDVITYFEENGFKIIEQKTCVDSGHIYTCLAAEYTGEKEVHSPGYIYYGILPGNINETDKKFIEVQLERLKKHRNGIMHTPGCEKEVKKLNVIINDIAEVTGNDNC